MSVEDRELRSFAAMPTGITALKPGDLVALYGWKCTVVDVFIGRTTEGEFLYTLKFVFPNGRESDTSTTLRHRTYRRLLSPLLNPDLPVVEVEVSS